MIREIQILTEKSYETFTTTGVLAPETVLECLEDADDIDLNELVPQNEQVAPIRVQVTRNVDAIAA